jgi:hypothetical protein
MLRTVLWHRQEAVPGYVELQYDVATWDRVAADYQKRERLLLNPLLALMAYRLTKVAKENPRLTSTIVGDQRPGMMPSTWGSRCKARRRCIWRSSRTPHA